MNAVITLSLAALVFGATIVLQWTMLRMKYRDELARQRARHLQQQQTTNQHLAQARQQLGQLQREQAAAQLQAKRHATLDAASVQSRSRAKEALQRTLDDAEASCRRLPPDGFADTLPSPQFPQGVDLLFRSSKHLPAESASRMGQHRSARQAI